MVLAFILLLGPAGFAQSYPPQTGWVVDTAGKLTATEKAALESLASGLDEQGRAQLALAVVTPAELGDLQRTEYAVELFQRWKLGHSKQKSDGLLLLFVDGPPGRRGLKVEVGYGLEAVLPDGKVSALMDRHAGPPLREGRFGAAALALARAFADEIEQAAPSAAPPPPPGLLRTLGLPASGVAALLFALGLLWILGRGLQRRMQPPPALALAIFLAALACAVPAPIPFQAATAALLLAGLAAAAVLWRRRCPRDGGFLERNETSVEATPTVPGREVETWSCPNPGCGYVRSATTVVPWVFAVPDEGGPEGSSHERRPRERSSSSSSSSGGGGSRDRFGGGGGGQSGGGGADRSY